MRKMSYKDRNINRKKERRRSIKENPSFYDAESFMSKEKQKARDLRNSPWWKSKISDGKCYYCGNVYKPAEITMDHKIPLARGGRSEKNNLVPACKECNNKKKYMLPVEWDEYLDNIKRNEV